MAVLELQQVKCPNCGANITSFNAFKAQVECPYCHQIAYNPLITSKEVPVPERLIQFKTNEEQFGRAMINALVENDYVPSNIFQVINPGNIIKAYLPMFLYEGTYQSSWSCSIGYEENEVTASSDGKSVRNRTVTKYRPANGTSNGNFAFLCLAYNGDDIPAELRQFSSTFPYDPLDSKDYDPALLGLDSDSSLQTLAINADSDIVWNTHGSNFVDKVAQERAKQQVEGQKVKDFRVSSAYKLENKGRYVMAPFWFVYYMYNGSQHYYIMDGVGSHNTLNHPIDAEQVAVVKKMEKTKKWVGLSWLLGLPFLLIGLEAAIIVAALGLVARLITNNIINGKIRKFLDSKRAEREAAAQTL